MGNKVYIGVVLVAWGASMSWLIGTKILPPFMHGEPPHTGNKTNDPVAWTVSVANQPTGFAVSQAVPGAEGTLELHSRVQLTRVPLARLAPRWMSSLIERIDSLKVDMRSRTTLDSLGNLSQFEASVKINDLPSAILMRGIVQDGFIRLKLQYADVVHRMDYPWPENAMLSSKLTPDDKLLSIYKGRRWQKEVYNPFGGPQGAIEMIEAEVTGEEAIMLNHRMVDTRRIEFRSMDTTAVARKDRIRSVMWVDMEGRVVREEISLMDVNLRFDRSKTRQAKRLAKEMLELDEYATLTTPNPNRQGAKLPLQ